MTRRVRIPDAPADLWAKCKHKPRCRGTPVVVYINTPMCESCWQVFCSQILNSQEAK